MIIQTSIYRLTDESLLVPSRMFGGVQGPVFKEEAGSSRSDDREIEKA